MDYDPLKEFLKWLREKTRDFHEFYTKLDRTEQKLVRYPIVMFTTSFVCACLNDAFEALTRHFGAELTWGATAAASFIGILVIVRSIKLPVEG